MDRNQPLPCALHEAELKQQSETLAEFCSMMKQVHEALVGGIEGEVGVLTRLDRIQEQTTKTNGRVTAIEDKRIPVLEAEMSHTRMLVSRAKWWVAGATAAVSLQAGIFAWAVSAGVIKFN